jgi:hypothetical protein
VGGAVPVDGALDAGEPGVPKSTLGLARFSALVTWKYFFSFAPVIFAVRTAGNCRMYALSSRTAPL